MEIISIPLFGSSRHHDSMGNKHLISVGDIPILSASSGLTHSEYNNSDEEDVRFLQIWMQPKEIYHEEAVTMRHMRNSVELVNSP